MKIQTIQTQYKGYRFRSRLEARWAVFFDAIGIPWDYEVEGFTNGEISYLPDFVIWGNGYIEIKPCEPTNREKEKVRMASLSDDVFGVCVLSGDPYSYLGSIGSRKSFHFYRKGNEQINEFFELLFFLFKFVPDAETPEERFAQVLPYIVKASVGAERARGARFEFGENG